MQTSFPIVRGIGIGKVLKLDDLMVSDLYTCGTYHDESESMMFSLDKAKQQLKMLHMKSLNRSDDSFAEVVEIMASLLEDENIVDGFHRELKNRENAYEAIVSNIAHFEKQFKNMDTLYYKERATVMRDIGQRLIGNLLNIETNPVHELSEPTIVIAEEIKPSILLDADLEMVKGMISTIGGETSHTAILCKAAGIPLLSGVEDLSIFVDGDLLILDALENKIINNPETEIIDKYNLKIERLAAYVTRLSKEQPKVLKLGDERIFVYGNISSPEDVKQFQTQKMDGVGLYRTEFLFLGSDEAPDEDMQFNAYKKVVEGLKGLPVTFRTIDIGGDKKLQYIDLGYEENPFLGYRAIRFCLEEPYVSWFRIQLRAMLRCQDTGPIKIMFPMVSTVHELECAKDILREEMCGLGYEVDSDRVKIGIMVEVPSVAICADIFAPHVDFFSIGTNDLTQFVLAADRMNPKLKNLYSYFNPAVLRLIKNVVEVGNKHDVEVSLCGEMASDPLAIPLLAGFGLRHFSVSPPYINRTKYMLKDLEEDKLKLIVDKVMDYADQEDVKAYMKEIQKDLYGSNVFYL